MRERGQPVPRCLTTPLASPACAAQSMSECWPGPSVTEKFCTDKTILVLGHILCRICAFKQLGKLH